MQKIFNNTRSKHYTQLFPDNMMIEHFGDTQPSISQRANKFQDFWESWSENQIILPEYMTHSGVHKILQPHMKSLFEWQIRAGMTEASGPGEDITKHLFPDTHNHKYMKKALFVRFATTDLMAVARILLS